MPDYLATPEGYTVTEEQMRDSAVVLIFSPEGNAHVYVKTGVSPADVLELVLGFAHHTVEQHFGAYSPDSPGEEVIDG